MKWTCIGLGMGSGSAGGSTGGYEVGITWVRGGVEGPGESVDGKEALESVGDGVAGMGE